MKPKRSKRKRKQTVDLRVSIIRKNCLVGKSTTAVVAECYSDEELLVEFKKYTVLTAEEALEWAFNVESLTQEQSLNCREGASDFSELKDWREWNEKLKTYRQRLKKV